MADRINPEAVRVARMRLDASCDHSGKAQRRTVGRRGKKTEKNADEITKLPDQTILIAIDPARLEKLALLAAAINLSNDIAAIIDKSSRMQLEELLGPDLRIHAVSQRKMSGPRRMLGTKALLEALNSDGKVAKRIWCQLLPKAFRPTGVLVDQAGSETEDTRNSLIETLRVAEEILFGEPDASCQQEDIAA